MPNGRHRLAFGFSGGFTLPVMLVILVGIGGLALATDVSSRYRVARESEAELIFRGFAYIRAIESFFLAEKDAENRRLPHGLSELEKDPRADFRRHIRRLYKDPITGEDFQVLKSGDGALIGVVSRSSAKLFSRQTVRKLLPWSAGATSYDQVLFQVDLDRLEASSGLENGKKTITN